MSACGAGTNGPWTAVRGHRRRQPRLRARVHMVRLRRPESARPCPGLLRQGDQIILNGKPAKPLNRSTINRQAIWRPGMSLDEIGALDPTKAHAVNPGASESAARLADLDALGIDQQVVFPTLFGEYFPALRTRARPSSSPRRTTTGSATSPRPAPVGCTPRPCFRSRTERRRSPSSSAAPSGGSSPSCCGPCSFATPMPSSASRRPR